MTRFALPLALFVAGTAAFAAAYCQAPLYYSNQNQYFLHGLAEAGEGQLREDWLANTRDLTPAFSALVAFTVTYLHPWAFHFYYALLQGVYTAAMLGLFATLVGEPAGRRWPIFIALFVAVHSALPRWCSYRWLGHDYPWFLQAGLAGQYILGAMFQPSTFGVLLVVAVYLFARGRAYAAAVCVALASMIHATYLLPAGMLVLGFMLALLREKKPWRAAGVGALALVLVLPVIAHLLLTFAPESPETFARAQDILVNFRIPHHSRPDLWLDGVAMFQIAWVVVALVLVWRNPLLPVLGVPFLLALLLTLAQVATGSHTLALLFPWRVSAVLIPIATTVILSRLVEALPAAAEEWPAPTAAAIVVVICVASGVWINTGRLGFHTSDEELPLLDFVRTSRRPGDLYFLPVSMPKKSRGSLSSDFKPLAEKKQDRTVLTPDLQRFRIYTGVPIFIDFKSIPYKDTEVLEWDVRFRLALKWQQQIHDGKLSEALPEMRRWGITHLVVPAGQVVEGDGIEKVYEDASYQVVRCSPWRTAAGRGRIGRSS